MRRLKTMTVRQLRANRRNARLGGPKTIEGKQKSSRNGLVHGLCAEANQCMILEGESLEVFNALDANFKQHYVPVDEVERSLVERMVTLTWPFHLHRSHDWIETNDTAHASLGFCRGTLTLPCP